MDSIKFCECTYKDAGSKYSTTQNSESCLIMKDKSEIGAIILGIAIFLGLVAVGYYIRSAAISFKQFERVVTVKGLAEQEHLADIVIWPIQFSETGNSLDGTFIALDNSAKQVEQFMLNMCINRV